MAMQEDWRKGRTMNARNNASGYSLIELMISIAIMAVVGSQLLISFSAQHRTYVQQDQLSRTQQDVRVLMDVVLEDLRMAGFMVPREFGVDSIDGGTTAADLLCMSNPAIIAEAEYDSASDRFDAASVTSSLGSNDTTLNLDAGDMDIDGDGGDDFAVGSGILISDGTAAHCARVTDITGNTVTFTPATPSGASYTLFSTRAVPAVTYEIATTTLLRNGLVLSNFIEDMQVEFGVDSDNNGAIEGAEFPIHDLAGVDRSRIRMARISLTSRTAQPDLTFVGARAAAANRNAGANDNFKRRKATADAVLRNMR